MLFRISTPPTKFGATAITEGIREVPQEIWERCLERHMNGDWGDLDEDSRATNDRAFKEGKSHWMYSVYKNVYKGKDICIETQGYGLTKKQMDLFNYRVDDYNYTVVMFPSER
tara:strand:+ start:1377 stop:1715 length:339 start_codon:yes stop_codon:yes gene_type:complete